MRILVVGGGVIGATSAYELAKEGHEVTLLERRRALGEETSFGNAGLYSPSDALAWASPATLKTALRAIMDPSLGIHWRPRFERRFWPWTLAFFRNCAPGRSLANTKKKLALARESHAALQEVVAETGIAFGHRREGLLYVFRTEGAAAGLYDATAPLRAGGLDIRFLDRNQTLALEPGLAPMAAEIAASVHSPDCETGDCGAFTKALGAWCAERLGVDLRLDAAVAALETAGERVAGVRLEGGERLEADLTVLAAGAESVFLAQGVGVAAPIYPVKGYSLTLPIDARAAGPTRGLVDGDAYIACSRYDGAVRIAAKAEFRGFDRRYGASDVAPLEAFAKKLWPEASLERARRWAGLRPMTPSSLPIIGMSERPGLALNIGHGHLGWTLSCGSARRLAAAIAR